ncbi:MAG: hypothetical protein IPO15_14760 [Anaerolineae bacterium]|uniref:P-type ATPase n=1 Tax=Candidatus Amarolinea dominans TaxID=3140696 RepID=UPI0031363121|nr:hypothetical protein [Anaerolineae bacterium]
MIGATLNNQGYAQVRGDEGGPQTALAQIVRLVQGGASSRPIQRLADQVSAIFVPVVLAIAALTFLGWYFVSQVGFTQALVYMIAVLVIACPCAAAWPAHRDHGGRSKGCGEWDSVQEQRAAGAQPQADDRGAG